MGISQLEYFIATVEQGNFSAAAQHLIVSQPAVSKGVRSLEQEFHITLFERNKQTLTLTPQGRRFYSQAKKIMYELYKLHSIADPLYASESVSHVTIANALQPFRGSLISEKFIENFKETYPEITVRTAPISQGEYPNALRNHVVDAAIVATTTDEDISPAFFVQTLLSYQPHILLRHDHPLARNASLCVADLSEYRIAIPYNLGSFYRAVKQQLTRPLRDIDFVALDFTHASHQKFLEDDGVIFVTPDPALKVLYPHHSFIPIRDKSLTLSINLVTLAEEASPATLLLQSFFATYTYGNLLH